MRISGAQLMPAAFFGHGSPMNAVQTNRYGTAWRTYAAGLPRPRAILVISAHWYVRGTRVTTGRRPPTVHDFNANFPPQLFAFDYPADGDPRLAERVIELAAPLPVERDDSTWGIDHGAYAELAHAFAPADVPVVMLSIDRTMPPSYHYALGARLAPLRDEGVFIMGSGNVVHNLELADRHAGTAAEPYDWAVRFNARLLEFVAARDHEPLVEYARLGPDARLAVPTPDHYLPLLYTLALQREGERVSTVTDGFAARSVSMLQLDIGS